MLLAKVFGESAGCIALRKISEDTCEMKRLYVRDKYRGIGLGKNLIQIFIEEARKLNYKYIRLDTLISLESAVNLYKYFGFYEIDSYIYNPLDGALYMEKKI